MGKFATRYAPNRLEPIHIKQASITRQEYTKECDINDIMAKYAAGIAPSLAARPPAYGDVSEIPDYQLALDTVLKAQDAFASLPSAVRDRFGNDPAALIDWLRDTGNRDEAIKLGLIDKPVEKPAEPVEPVETKEGDKGNE